MIIPPSSSAKMAGDSTSEVTFEYPGRTCLTSTRIVGPRNNHTFCLPCFDRIPKDTNRHRLVQSHCLTNSITYGTKRRRECIICNTNLLIPRSLDECGMCYRKYTELLEKLPQGYDLNKKVFVYDIFTDHVEGIVFENSEQNVGAGSTSISAKNDLYEGDNKINKNS